MKQLNILTVLLLYPFFVAHSQTKIKAVVLDEKKTPITYATVENLNDKRGVITNAAGMFEMDYHPNDSILIRCLGYQNYQNTAEQIQRDSIVFLKESSFDMGEVTIMPVNANDIVKNFRKNFRKNYPNSTMLLSGNYEEYSFIEDECQGFVQCNIDIFASNFRTNFIPSFKTKVYDYKLYRPENKKYLRISHKHHFSQFVLRLHEFLWDNKHKFTYAGMTTYDDLELLTVNFHPKRIEKFIQQFTGTLYFDKNNYALVLLKYELLPNENDHFYFRGVLQKPVKEENEIKYGYYEGFFYPAHVISKITINVPGGQEKHYYEDTTNIDFSYYFRTDQVEYKPKGFEPDDLFLRIMYYGKDHSLEEALGHSFEAIINAFMK